MSRIFLSGTFPPLLHGMANVNQALWQWFHENGLDIVKLDTSPKSLKRDIFSRLSRLTRVIESWLLTLKKGTHKDNFYIAISGGWGQLYDVISLIFARIKRMRCFIHHHSFAYLQQKNLLTLLLVKIAGWKAIHIVLCSEMAHQLNIIYGVQKTIRLSNLAFFPPEPYLPTKEMAHTIGYLSNITIEKGANEIIDLAYSIRKENLPYTTLIAGPCHDPVVTERLLRAQTDGTLEWKGSVYGKDKTEFWHDIDLFVFPTRYKNEAEPLVIWEALSAGVPVVAYQRGCIGEQLGDAGILIPPDKELVSKVLSILYTWQKNSHSFLHLVEKSKQRYPVLHRKSRLQRDKLMKVLVAGNR